MKALIIKFLVPDKKLFHNLASYQNQDSKISNNSQMRRKNYSYIGSSLRILLLISACTLSQEVTSKKRVSFESSPGSIYQLMKKVADWQLDSIRKNGWSHQALDWTNGALYTGLWKFGEIANDMRYYKFLKENVGEKFNWMLQTGSRRYNADYYCVGQSYSRLYEIYKDPKMIADLKSLADTLISRPLIQNHWILVATKRIVNGFGAMRFSWPLLPLRC